MVDSRVDDEQTRYQVAYWRGRTRVVFWNRYTSTTMTNPVGRAVQVLVDPVDPHNAVVSAGLAGGGLVGGVFTAVGAVTALAGVVVGLVVLV